MLLSLGFKLQGLAGWLHPHQSSKDPFFPESHLFIFPGGENPQEQTLNWNHSRALNHFAFAFSEGQRSSKLVFRLQEVFCTDQSTSRMKLEAVWVKVGRRAGTWGACSIVLLSIAGTYSAVHLRKQFAVYPGTNPIKEQKEICMHKITPTHSFIKWPW